MSFLGLNGKVMHSDQYNKKQYQYNYDQYNCIIDMVVCHQSCHCKGHPLRALFAFQESSLEAWLKTETHTSTVNKLANPKVEHPHISPSPSLK